MSTLELTLEQLNTLNSLEALELKNLLLTVEEWKRTPILEQLIQYQREEELLKTVRKYSPHEPHPKQRLFLTVNCPEILYGGAAGGGKSDALLMAALQFAHVPGAAALVLRKDSARLRLAGGLIPRSQEWLTRKPGCHWNGTERTWTIETEPGKAPFTLQFGYLQNSSDMYRYGSSEYQTIIWDELTEFAEDEYLFLFSRLRAKESIRSYGIPYRMLGGTNPGGKGHEWCRNRFLTKEAEQDLKNNMLRGVYYKETRSGRVAMIPAKIRDNPSVNEEEYKQNLSHLPIVARERMMAGDWTIMPSGLIKAEWIRYYRFRGNSYIVELLETKILDTGEIIHTDNVIAEFDIREAKRITTIDTAGGKKEIKDNANHKKLSHNVLMTADYKRLPTGQALLIRNVKRGKGWNYPEIRKNTLDQYEEWKPSRMKVEDQSMGMALYGDLQFKIPLTLVSTGGKDKVTRASKMFAMFERGEIYLPQAENSWRPTLESEWLSWTGDEEETDDQCDVTAYLCMEVDSKTSGTIKMGHDPRQQVKIASQQDDPDRKTGWF